MSLACSGVSVCLEMFPRLCSSGIFVFSPPSPRFASAAFPFLDLARSRQREASRLSFLSFFLLCARIEMPTPPASCLSKCQYTKRRWDTRFTRGCRAPPPLFFSKRIFCFDGEYARRNYNVGRLAIEKQRCKNKNQDRRFRSGDRCRQTLHMRP